MLTSYVERLATCRWLYIWACIMNMFIFSNICLGFSESKGSAYEPNVILNVIDFLPSVLINGELYKIDSFTRNNGYENTYVIKSDYGNFIAHRTDSVSERIQEIYAIHELNKITRSDAFVSGLVGTVSSPLKALKGLATEPYGTVSGAVKGAGALILQASEMLRSSRSEYENTKAQEFVGLGALKRKIARELDFDIYTTNVVLQNKLGEVALAAFSGGLSLAPLTSKIDGEAGTALSGLKNSKALKSLLGSQSPESLTKINRDHLILLGVDKGLIRKFLNHQWLSPRHETTIVEALVRMDGARDYTEIIERAVRVKTEIEAVFLMRQVEMILAFHQNVSPISSFSYIYDNILFYTLDRRQICVLPADYLSWNIASSIIADQTLRSGYDAELWVSGVVSTIAKKEYEKRNWKVVSFLQKNLQPNYDR